MAGALVRWSSCSQEMRFHKLILQEPQSLSKSRDLCPPASLEQTVTVSFKGFLLEFKYDWNFFINKIILAVEGITICKRHCLCFLKEIWFGDGPNFLEFVLWWFVKADSNQKDFIKRHKSGLNLPMLKWLLMIVAGPHIVCIFGQEDLIWSAKWHVYDYNVYFLLVGHDFGTCVVYIWFRIYKLFICRFYVWSSTHWHRCLTWKPTGVAPANSLADPGEWSDRNFQWSLLPHRMQPLGRFP